DENPKESGYQRVVVILVDSRAGYPGVSGDDYDARSGMGYAVDLNFLDSIDVMMERKMDDSISEMEK
ncbi:MAG: hypothetical protein GWO08_11305, partial [Gammaproteobacteria bacterium]|nr:hypothetical protein [Gammaproteobacteria bacterium]NIR94223.1 hypothetical protein [Gammaproteobacteria bacterium]NIT52536.1 hypothetical protein [candidate division Zixibacteria bacterium]NIW47342.1 hypothetical protein [Gammaproteobacteria bacterium]NIX57880.1 hypothetical protein [candidate division Zixibacteria bacterium]